MPITSAARLGLAVALLAAGCAQDRADTSVTRSAPAPTATASPTAASPSTAPVPTVAPSPTVVPTPVVASGDGRLALAPVAGTGPVSGPGAPASYVVEVEGGLGVDPQAFAREVDAVLTDSRSWGAGGRRALHRVPGGEVAFRVSLVSPRLADRLCAPLQTNGYFSCGTRGRAVLNVARWLTGADAYGGDLATYRQYLVNHEVGHLLGRGHEPCPGPGVRAPVMLQQTKGLDGCAVNSWPYP